MHTEDGWEQARHQLAASDCEPLSLSALLALADDECRQKWDNLSLGYPPSRGDELLLAEIAGGLYAASGLSAEHLLGVVEGEHRPAPTRRAPAHVRARVSRNLLAAVT